ncbi:MAG: hypothetical protein ACETWE_14430 [Candidatus Bathyarchaeia archaeon]
MSLETILAFAKPIRLDYSDFSTFGVLLSGLLAGDLTGPSLNMSAGSPVVTSAKRLLSKRTGKGRRGIPVN